MKLLAYNVEYCKGINKKWKYMDAKKLWKPVLGNLKKIAKELKPYDFDVIGFIETDAGSFRIDGKSQAKLFSKELKMPFWAEKIKHATTSIAKYANKIPTYRMHANAIVSKHPTHDTNFLYFSKGVKRLVINTIVKLPVGKSTVDVALFAVHLSVRKNVRVLQIKELTDMVESCSYPKIVFGDFNIFGGYQEINPFLKNTGLINTSKFAKGDVASYPSWKPTKHIDLILASPKIKVSNFEVLDIQISDHRPVMMDFKVTKSSSRKTLSKE